MSNSWYFAPVRSGQPDFDRGYIVQANDPDMAREFLASSVRRAIAVNWAMPLSPLSCSGLKPNFLDKMASNGVVLQPTFFSKDDDTDAPAVGQGHEASKFKGAFQ